MYMNVGCKLGHYMKVDHDLVLEIDMKIHFRECTSWASHMMCLVTIK